MFWADKIRKDIQTTLTKKTEPFVVRDEKTASGRVHVGSLRGVAIHDEIAQLLSQDGTPAIFLYEINDIDPMDDIPSYLDEREYAQHLGKPLKDVPAPDGKSKNFAEQYAHEFMNVIKASGFTPEYYRASELYTRGDMNDVILTALDRADRIRTIYKEVSGSEKPEGWLPIHMICEKCGKVLTTKTLGWDGNEVQYQCMKEGGAGGSRGCGYEGSNSPFNGNATFPWKVEWAAKWAVVGVDIEGAGKDHSTKGGARDVSNHIAREIFGYEPPYDIPYEFFLVGGAKMSSSKGAGDLASDVAALLPVTILRVALLGTRPMRAINFDVRGTTIPALFDRYDEIAEKYWSGAGDDDARLFERVHHSKVPEKYYRMRFSQVAFLSQMPHIDVFAVAAEEHGMELSEMEKAALEERVQYAQLWLNEYAPERYVFKLQSGEISIDLSDAQKRALTMIVEYLQENKQYTGEEFHKQLHAIKTETAIEPKEFFSALYQIFLGRDSGPQAGWFLSVLPQEYVLERLQHALR
tara:strand:- start:9897 stop:11462 length:1566 start_codon:yes stop_codon:yes gene_type:complete